MQLGQPVADLRRADAIVSQHTALDVQLLHGLNQPVSVEIL